MLSQIVYGGRQQYGKGSRKDCVWLFYVLINL